MVDLPIIVPALGLLVGLIMALTGAGGGMLAVPLLVVALDIELAVAAPVALLAAGVAALVGTLLGLRDGHVRYRAALFIAGIGAISAPLGLWLAHRSPDAPLAILFAVVLAVVAWRSLRQGLQTSPPAAGATQRTLAPCVLDPGRNRLRWTLPCARALAMTGAAAGLLAGLLGIGGGFVIVPALRRYSDLAAPAIVATSLAVVALVAVSGVASAALGSVLPWPLASGFAAGSVAGLLLGRPLVHHLEGLWLHRLFAAVATVAALLLLARGLGILP